MPNGTWKRTTTEERRASRKIRYAHVSVLVGVKQDELTGMLVHTRTPRGKGSTATRLTPKLLSKRDKQRVKFGTGSIGHDWAGAYRGRLASIEAMRRARRNSKKKSRRELSIEMFLLNNIDFTEIEARVLAHEMQGAECLTQSATAA